MMKPDLDLTQAELGIIRDALRLYWTIGIGQTTYIAQRLPLNINTNPMEVSADINRAVRYSINSLTLDDPKVATSTRIAFDLWIATGDKNDVTESDQ